MYHPYQCIEICKRLADDDSEANVFLLAASGPKLYSLHLSTGAIVSSWPSDDPSNFTSVIGKPERVDQTNKERKASETPQELPNIIKVKVTPSGRYVVVVTAEDKAVRVFEVSADGELCHLSLRVMPKRPSAIDIMPDEQSFLVGDKFGDVYQLPLLPKGEEPSINAEKPDETSIQKYTPAASEKTVHSKANLRALREQLRQAKNRGVKKPKAFDFEHTLLLGHVSMLTDLLITQYPTAEGVMRNHIITADRDEHIRVSRGPPQSYVIEGHCLDHDEFATKLCLLNPKFPQLLASGGADLNVRIWDWTQQNCILKQSTRNILRYLPGYPLTASGDIDDSNHDSRFIISNMWSVPFPEDGFTLLIAYEGISRLCKIAVLDVARMLAESKNPEKPWLVVNRYSMPGNVIDVAYLNDSLIVSVDNIHTANSTTEIDDIDESDVSSDESDGPRTRLWAYTGRASGEHILAEPVDGYDNEELGEAMMSTVADLNRQLTFSWHEKALQALLYPLDHLRKRNADAVED